MFDQLISRFHDIQKALSGQARISEKNIEDAIQDVRVALIEADVALPTIKKLVDQVKEKAIGEKVLSSLTPAQAFIGVVHKELAECFGSAKSDINLQAPAPASILMTGLQGSGKTTTSAKLAKHLKEHYKKKVLLVSCDVYRPAAIEQLKILSDRISVPFYDTTSPYPLDIAQQAIDYAKKNVCDIIIFDTAGRTTTDHSMMNEIAELHHLVSPVETFLVIDAMVGQDSVAVSSQFKEKIDITGVIVSKMDGDARGGCALSVWDKIHVPIKLCGTSEKLDGLEEFHPDRMASRVLGKGDIISLIEQAKHSEKQAKEKAENKKPNKKKFNMNNLREQLQQVKNISAIPGFIDKLPKELSSLVAQQIPQTSKTVKVSLGIIDSMTREERRKPEIIKSSRKKRIAAGAGTTVQEVNKLLAQYEKTEKMIKKLKKGGNNSLERLMSGLKGFGN